MKRALLAVFDGFKRRFVIWGSLSANAYGIYLVHYRFGVSGQYTLSDTHIGAIAKATVVFTSTLVLSWGCSAG